MKTYKLTAQFYHDYIPAYLDRTYTITLLDDEVDKIRIATEFLKANHEPTFNWAKFSSVSFTTTEPDDFDIPENEDFRIGTALVFVTEYGLYYRIHSKFDSNDMVDFSMTEMEYNPEITEDK
jgi:hypothetical protein